MIISEFVSDTLMLYEFFFALLSQNGWINCIIQVIVGTYVSGFTGPFNASVARYRFRKGVFSSIVTRNIPPYLELNEQLSGELKVWMENTYLNTFHLEHKEMAIIFINQISRNWIRIWI